MFKVPIILFASWLLVGLPLPLFIAMTVVIFGLVSALGSRFTHKTIALLGVMCLMVAQSVLIVVMIHFQLWQPSPHLDLNGTAAWLGRELFGLDFRLAEAGIPAAIFVGVYMEFVRSKMSLSRAFPNLTFYDPTDEMAMIVAKLARTANIECPNLCLVDSGAPCAFSIRTKRGHTIALSIGLLESFDKAEIEACLAHEVAHIKNRDFALRAVVTIARTALFAKVLSYFIETALYRTRELLADRTAAVLIGGPGPLISALSKLQEADGLHETPTGNAICFFDAKKGVFELLSKHPNLSTRIRMLREMDTARGDTTARKHLIRGRRVFKDFA